MQGTSMKYLDRSDLRSQAVAMLRASIVSGELSSGTVHSAATLAAQMGVSITPVREAILDLANAGLIEVIRNRGFRVLKVADEDLDEITEVRQMLEPPAMRLIVQRATDADLQRLLPMVEEMKVSSSSDLSAFLVQDHNFHLSLVALSGNARLRKVINMLRDQTRLTGIASLLNDGALVASAFEHEMILQALIDREGEKAVELMSRHIAHTRGSWAGRLEASEHEDRSPRTRLDRMYPTVAR
jgi:DNA-binding GntR family transcriptional regulator